MKNEEKLKTYVVHNPVSGTSDAEMVQSMLRRALHERAIPYEIYQTMRETDLRTVIGDAIRSGFRRFVAVGGDGTIQGVASSLIHTDLPLVIIPTGTVNALARELKIPFTLEESVRWWMDSTEQRLLDVIEVNGRCYLLNISVGRAAGIIKDVKREDIHRFGLLPYIREALRQITVPTFRFQLTIDGHKTFVRAAEIMVANSGILFGWGALRLEPDADLDTGKMSVCWARAKTIFDYARLALKIALQLDTGADEVNCVDARREVQIETNRRVPVQGDGEWIGNTPVILRLIPRALNVIVPARESGTNSVRKYG